MLQKIQDLLEQGKEILVASALYVDGSQVTLATLILALFCELSIDKDDPMPYGKRPTAPNWTFLRGWGKNSQYPASSTFDQEQARPGVENANRGPASRRQAPRDAGR
jgi:hypothetical protein